VAALDQLSRTTAAPCAPALQAGIAEAARALGLATRPLASGAGHDAAFVARIAPAAMIFTPSKDGKSHCPEEWTDPAAIADAADVLLNALILTDRSTAAPA
jgi:N-carbamoyl-L-amino-acid hydrolase